MAEQRSLVNISSCVIHDPELAEGYGSYAVSKIAFTSFVQFLATEVPVEEIQIVSIHPGGIYTEGLQDMCAKGSWSWDDGAYNSFHINVECLTVLIMTYSLVSLPGNFIVWASSPGAAFLHGRFVWASWDITELQKLFSSHRDPEELKHLLKIHVNGLE
jgi:NAD(P)-dependent dehydrogenase (short-subunit alcohol dehydrogenase family)